MLGNERLQFGLRREAFFFEWFKLSLLIPGVDALCHIICSKMSSDENYSSLQAPFQRFEHQRRAQVRDHRL